MGVHLTGQSNSRMNLAVTLALVLFSCLFSEGQSQECVNGLVSAERVRQLGRVAGDRIKNGRKQQRIIPDISFTCSGTVTRWIVAGKETDTVNLPVVQIWRETFDGSGVYTKVHGMSLPKRDEEDPPIYEFAASMDVHPGDILGLFEPVVGWLRLYYTDQYGPVNYYKDTGSAVTPPTGDFDVSSANGTMNDMPLVTVEISPTDDSSASECIRNFATMDAVMIGVQQIGGGKNKSIHEEQEEQRIIPGINFTCHGFITKWILAAKWSNKDVYPDLQTWNSTDGTTYMKQGATTFSLEGGSAEMSYYEYNPNPPHEFNDGDVLGMFIPKDPRYKLFFERTDSGPENYVEDMADSAQSEFTTNSGGIQTTNAVPLIAVEVSIPQPSTPSLSVTLSSSAPIALRSSVEVGIEQTASVSATVDPTPTPSPEPVVPSTKNGLTSSDVIGTTATRSSQVDFEQTASVSATVDPTSSPSPSPEPVDQGRKSGSSSSDASGTIAAVVSVAAVVILGVIIMAVIGGVFLRRQKRSKTYVSAPEVQENQAYGTAVNTWLELDNPAYDTFEMSDYDNSQYGVLHIKQNALTRANLEGDGYSDPRYHGEVNQERDSLAHCTDPQTNITDENGYTLPDSSGDTSASHLRTPIHADLESGGYNDPCYHGEVNQRNSSMESKIADGNIYTQPELTGSNAAAYVNTPTRADLEAEGYSDPRYYGEVDQSNNSLSEEDSTRPDLCGSNATTHHSMTGYINTPTRAELEADGYSDPRYYGD